MNRNKIIGALLLAGILVWAGYRAWMAHENLVTLNVRNMDVHRVASKIEWQTWERIIVNKNVGGSITLNVHKAPLEDVLDIIALQSGARWTALFPIYRVNAAEDKFEKVVRGDLGAATNGWSNAEKIFSGRWGALGGFGNTLRAANKLVSAQIEGKDLAFTTLALSRFSKAVIVPEDSATATINLKLEQAPFEKAVAQVARQARRKWTKVFTIQPLRQTILATKQVPPNGTGDTNAPAASTNPVVKVRDVQVAATPRIDQNPEEQQRQLEAFMATATPEERQKAQEQITAAAQLQTLPQAERQQRMQEMASQAKQSSQANLEDRVQQRLKNGTVEQRLAHDREVLKRQQQRAQK